MMTLGQWLRQRRKEKRLTQAALAALSGVSASYVSTIERQQPHSVSGAKLRPEPNVIAALADALGASRTEALALAGYAAPGATVRVTNAEEFLRVLEAHGLTVPNFLTGTSGLDQVGEDELNEVLSAMLFQLKLKADKKLH